MIIRTAWAVVLTMAVFTTAAAAQGPWMAELRGGIDIPTQDVVDDELGTGYGFEGTVTYHFLPYLGIYAGWDWIRFTPDNSFAGPDVEFEETGYAFGLRYERPLMEDGPLTVWVRGGGIFDHIELEIPDQDVDPDSGHGLGFEVGAGVGFDIVEGWMATPGVRYRSLSREVDIPGGGADVDLRYLALELGVAVVF